MVQFALAVWDKIKGWAVQAALALVFVWYVFSRGEKKAKDKAEAEKLENKVVVAETIAKSINDDVKVVNEVEKQVDALPDPAVAAHARKWVRNKI